MTDSKPLRPMNGGVIIIVGGKNTNFDKDLLESPRVIIWDSQQESWWMKDIPTNCHAIFFTRFIGHAAFAKIVGEARKRQITIFNPQGTGRIAEQVRQLLGIARQTTPGGNGATQHTKVEIKETKVETITVPAKKQAVRIRELVEYNQPIKGQAARIIGILRGEGYKFSEASVQTSVGTEWRKKNKSTPSGHQVKHEATPTPQVKSEHQSDLVKMLDDVAITLQLIREEVVRLNDLQIKLKEFIR